MSEAEKIPRDFIAYRQMYITPSRYVRTGVNEWHELRWSDRWNFFHECDDAEVLEEYWRAEHIMIRHIRPPMVDRQGFINE